MGLPCHSSLPFAASAAARGVIDCLLGPLTLQVFPQVFHFEISVSESNAGRLNDTQGHLVQSGIGTARTLPNVTEYIQDPISMDTARVYSEHIKTIRRPSNAEARRKGGSLWKMSGHNHWYG
jgi:hypothetical protein